MLITGEIYQLINFASFSRWFFIALATLGMLIHRYRFPLHPRPFRVCVFCGFCAKLYAITPVHETESGLLFLINQRCPWPSPSPSQWFASSSWVCLCTLTPGTQGKAVLSRWPGSQFTMWPSTAIACHLNGDAYSVSHTEKSANLSFLKCFSEKMHWTVSSQLKYPNFGKNEKPSQFWLSSNIPRLLQQAAADPSRSGSAGSPDTLKTPKTAFYFLDTILTSPRTFSLQFKSVCFNTIHFDTKRILRCCFEKRVATATGIRALFLHRYHSSR